MLTIWKTVLEIKDEQEIEVPKYTDFLFVLEQYGKLCIWYRCNSNPNMSKEKRTIAIRGTGHPDVPSLATSHYIGSCIMPNGHFVWHVFEILNRNP